MAPPTTCWEPVKNQSSVNSVPMQWQQWFGMCQPASSWLSLFKVSISHLFELLFKKNGFLAVSGSDLELELTTSSLRQYSSWACLSATCSVPCINLKALICWVLLLAKINESHSGPVFGQVKISGHRPQRATYGLKWALMNEARTLAKMFH